MFINSFLKTIRLIFCLKKKQYNKSAFVFLEYKNLFFEIRDNVNRIGTIFRGFILGIVYVSGSFKCVNFNLTLAIRKTASYGKSEL